MTILGWIIAIYMGINALYVITKVGQRKTNSHYTGVEAVALVILSALIIIALAIA